MGLEINYVNKANHLVSLITSSATDTSVISYCVHWVHHMTYVIWLKIQRTTDVHKLCSKTMKYNY